MKKNVLFVGLLITSGLYAQSFSDNFDTYIANQKLGPQSPTWTTWSFADGGAEDVNVVTTNPHSGANCVYFSSTAQNGGPADVILPFGGQYNTGSFEFKSYFFVQTGKSAYFNFQAESTPGNEWNMDCFMLPNGNLVIGGSGLFANNLTTTYTQNVWFELKLQGSLNTGLWEVFIDGVSKGTYQNKKAQVASADIYPTNGNGFYIDDVSYTYTPYTMPSLSAAAFYIDPVGAIAGQTVNPKVIIRNTGSTSLTSFNVDLTYNGSTLTQNVSGVNIPSLGTYELALNQSLTLAAGTLPMTLSVSNVNGGSDGYNTDNTKTIQVTTVTPAAGKVVVGEEGTGTWCQWCPRGAVYMDYLSNKYGDYFAGIAVHNGDPMTVSVYDAGMGNLISGYPSALVDRGSSMDPADMEDPLLSRIVVAPIALMENSASLSGNNLTVNVKTTFQQNGSGAYKTVCVLTEDAVTGTASGYNQSNAYAGGNSGEMGGFELLPSSVPASQMVYNHVARAIQPSFDGAQGTLPSSFTSGSMYTNSYSFTIDPSWSTNDMNIVSFIIAPNGSIDNAGHIKLQDALNTVNTQELFKPETFVNIYPNPAHGNATLHVRPSQKSEVCVEITNALGQRISFKNYGTLEGKNDLSIQSEFLKPGMYFVHVTDNSGKYIQTLIVQ